MGLPLEQAGIAIVIHSFFYALASSRLGRVSHFIKLEKIALMGMAAIIVGIAGYSLSPNFTVFALMVVPVGIGSGMVDSSLNSYAVKFFSSRQINWLHCFWGLGATVSPMLMTHMILSSGWRTGYASIAAIHGLVAVVVAVSLFKGLWKKMEKIRAACEQPALKKQYLTKKRHKFMTIAVCFLYGGIEYSTGFWVTSVLLESRGLGLEAARMYPAVYYASIMAGRMAFGFLANRFSDSAIIRLGFLLSFAGLAIMIFTGNILGMALTGLGFAPIFPCFIHVTSGRFDSKILTKLVGYEIAALGAGTAILSSLVGQVLAHVSLEALFPIVTIMVALAFLSNEALERAVRK